MYACNTFWTYFICYNLIRYNNCSYRCSVRRSCRILCVKLTLMSNLMKMWRRWVAQLGAQLHCFYWGMTDSVCVFSLDASADCRWLHRKRGDCCMPACPTQKVKHTWSKGCPAASWWVFCLGIMSLFGLAKLPNSNIASQNASGICGFLALVQMRSDRTRRHARQKLTNRSVIALMYFELFLESFKKEIAYA